MSVYRQFFIFVEGEKDRLFFAEVIRPIFLEKYDWVRIIAEWTQEKPDLISNHIRSIKSENWNADYIFVADMDTPCVTAKKEEIRKRFKNIDEDRIMIVRKEIESWYLAALDIEGCRSVGIRSFPKTDDITKEEFNGLVPKKFDSEIDFMQEILKHFDVETAKQKNESFRYFAERFVRKYGLKSIGNVDKNT